MPVPDFGRHGVQRVVGGREVRLIHMRRAQQRAVERVGPTMIGTTDASGECAFGSGAHACAPMPADIEERAHRAGRVAGDDDAFSDNVAQEVVARIRDAAALPAQIQRLK